MAFTAVYDQPTSSYNSGSYCWRTTSGGTVWTRVTYTSTVFDYFSDTAVVDDAIYFSEGSNGLHPAGLRFNVGTAFAATSYTLAWEYYKNDSGWVAIEDLLDNTSSFSITGQNDVKFPQQWSPHILNVQGHTSGLWVRVRLSAVDTITEGGANQTDTVKYGRGTLRISGTTDEVPGTFKEIYDWIVANESHISVGLRNDNSFDFTKVGLNIDSRVVTTNEVIEIGPNCNSNNNSGNNSLDYVTSGIKKSDTKGYAGSTFIVYGRANSNVIVCGINSKFYGTTFRTGKTNADAYSYGGYITHNGEWIDCNVELSTRFPGTGSSVSNCRIVGSLLIAGSLRGEYSGVYYLCTSSSLFYVYRSGFDLANFGYEFKGNGTVFYLYQAAGNQDPYTWNLINPSTALNLLADSVTPIRIGYKGTLANWSKIFTYDDSTSTFSADLSTSNVPFYGDVGDMIYFSPTVALGAARDASLNLELPTLTNDYVYKWEIYDDGVWVEMTKTWDQTLNLSQNGKLFIGTTASPDNTTINGHTGDWLRMTIVTKGTVNQEATVCQQYGCGCANQWNLKEKYSLDMKVIDGDGVAIETATVTATDENGVEIFSVDTAVDGTIAQQQTLVKHWYFEPVANPSTLISENVYTTFDLIISKAGYGVYRVVDLPLGGKIDWVVKLGAGTQTTIYDSTLTDVVLY